jgi:hypothetical protein
MGFIRTGSELVFCIDGNLVFLLIAANNLIP